MKKDYKDSINLPKTAFPMKANLPEREPEILKRWQELNIYKRTREARRDCPRFILHDGPPYANGHIHIGHAVNKTLKDIVIKSKILSGYDAPYIPGWDCHGLPIEINVEKVHGKPSEKISAERFRKACREYALEQIDIQREEFIRLGGLGDWYNPYITMAPTYEADIIRSLAKIIANGHLFRGYKPVHWCVDCCSALAEAEVEYRDKSSPAIDVKFTVLDDAALMVRCQVTETIKGGGPISIVIWTTTPWTLPANYAVAVSPKLEYVLVECEGQYGKERFILAEALVEDTLSRYGIEHYRIIGSCLGAALEGLKLQHPFYDRVVPIVLGDHVTLDTGTGAVHTAPGHGPEDYLIALKYNLPIESPVDVDGKFLLKTPLFAGEHINKANEHIIEILQAKGHLLHIEKIQHSYPHCWRHKTSLIFRATPQWFISMDQNGLRRQVIDEIFKVEWLPDWGQARLAGMIENRPDWCISRQRTWGVPLPLFTHKETGELHPDMINIMESVAQLMDEKGIEAWHQLEPETLLGPEAQYYEKCSDVLDVWFDSGVSHAAVLEKNPSLHQPADMYLEGSDQHRGWFQSSLLTAVAMRGQAPYKTVLTHGFAVDAHGRKMSKSLGNVIAPEKVISSLGADILRLWIAATDYRAEMSVSDEILKRIADTYRRIRNTARYLLANLYDFDPEQHLIPKEAMLSLDRWAVDRARILQGQIINAYDEYQFHLIYQKIHNFCTVDLGSFYLDIIKDRQYTTPKESLTRRSAQTAMYHIAEALTRWLAPILSFTAEEIWQYLPGKRPKSVFLTTWYEDFVTVGEDETMGQLFWEQILIIRDSVNKALEIARNEGKIGSPLDAELDLYCSSELYKKLALLDNELRFVFIVSEARVHPEKEKPAELEFSEMPGLAIKISASSYQKCARCWHHRPDIGRDKQHPDLCGRCVTNITTEGEVRYFV